MKRYWLVPVGLLMILISVGGLLLRNQRANRQLAQQSDTLQAAKAIIRQVKEELLVPVAASSDSVAVTDYLARQDTIRRQVAYWLHTVNNRKVPALTTLFADTVQRYYLGQNFTRRQIEQDMRRTIKRTPAGKVVFDPAHLSIQPDSGGYTAFLDAVYFRDTTRRTGREVIYRIGFNPQLQIDYVRVFLDSTMIARPQH